MFDGLIYYKGNFQFELELASWKSCSNCFSSGMSRNSQDSKCVRSTVRSQ